MHSRIRISEEGSIGLRRLDKSGRFGSCSFDIRCVQGVHIMCYTCKMVAMEHLTRN